MPTEELLTIMEMIRAVTVHTSQIGKGSVMGFKGFTREVVSEWTWEHCTGSRVRKTQV